MSTSCETQFTPTRVIAVVLDEADWQAFVGIEPEPVAWVKQQIRERISATRAAPRPDPGRPDR